MLELPPPYAELALREGGDAFVRAVLEAEAGAGAGLLVWVRRYDTVDCAVILEPEEALGDARHVMFAGLAAVADSLNAISPPEKPLSLVWPDRVYFDGGLVGGARLAWPRDCVEAATPDWLVFGFTLRTVLPDDIEGTPPAALVDDGFDDFENGPFIESFARHLMLALDDWSQGGPGAALKNWCRYGEQGAAHNLSVVQGMPTWLVEGEVGR